MMTNSTPDRLDDAWTNCPVGEVGRLVGRLRQQRRREQLRQAATGVSCVIVILLSGAYAASFIAPPDPGVAGFTCIDVHRLADAYLAGQLDADQTARIETHLSSCPLCRQFLESKRESHAARPPTRAETASWRRAQALPAAVLARVH